MRTNLKVRLSAHAVLIVVTVLTVTPLAFMIGMSFKPPAEIFASPLTPFPVRPTLENYVRVFESSDVGRQFVNSLVFAGLITLGQVVIAVPAAYAFSYWRFRGSNLLFGLCLATLPVPFVLFFLPNYVVVAQAGGINSFAGMIIPQLASAYGIFLLRQHFIAFPRSIIEAARLDGASEFSIMSRIVFRSMLPAVTVVAIIVFTGAWNEFLWPSLVAPAEDMQILTVGLTQFASSEGGHQWGPTMAAATLTSVPTFIAYLLARRSLLSTVGEGAVQG